MAIIYIDVESTPNYIALSSDFTSGCPADGVGIIGAKIYTEDTYEWFIVDEDLKIMPYVSPPAPEE